MLAAMGLEPFRHLNVHGYWQMDAGKMSKSLGNVVEPRALAAQYGVDQVRYFFLREMVFGLDAHFSEEALVSRINSDLANDLGNLLARSLGMAFKYRQGVVPAPGVPSDLDQEVILLAERAAADFLKHFPTLEFTRALAGLWELIGHLNRYIVANAPWELAKQPEAAARLDTVLYHLLESLRLIAALLRPVMPAERPQDERATGPGPGPVGPAPAPGPAMGPPPPGGQSAKRPGPLSPGSRAEEK